MSDSVSFFSNSAFIYVSLLSLLILVVLSFVFLLSCLLAKHNKPKEWESSDLHGKFLILFQEKTEPYFLSSCSIMKGITKIPESSLKQPYIF